MTDKIEISFDCKSCGANPATLELPDNPSDNDIARCKSCGIEFGQYGDIKAEVRKLAKDEVAGLARGAFKGMKGWNVK